jgi:hypothetical protein
VLTRQEVRALLGVLTGPDWLMATLLYGAGLRLMECLRLRADIGIYGQRRQPGIYCGLVSGYPARLAGYADEKRLDKVGMRGG